MTKKIIAPAVLTTVLFTSMLPTTHAFAKHSDANELSKLETIHNKQDVKNVLKSLPASKEIKKNYKQYEVSSVEKDDKGFTHYTLVPKANGKKALNKEVKVHVNKEGKVTFVNGDLDQKEISPSNSVKISNDQAVDKAFETAGVKKSEAKNVEGRKVIKKSEVAINGDKNRYVYDIELVYLEPQPATWKIEVDAETGEVVSKLNILAKATATTGTGVGVKGDTKTINIAQENGRYYLSDITHGTAKIETYDAFNTTTKSELISDTDKIFNSNQQNAGVDAHYNANVVYNYYRNTFNRNSYDGNGAPIYSTVHYDRALNNAFWNGEAMFYGDGDGYQFGPLSQANDIVAHELTHAVTQETAGLIYRNQSGALNESISDVFGYFVDPDFLMGEDAYTPGKSGDALRSMQNPEQYGQPGHMKSYKNTSQDNGGVHINSGIPNKAFYNTVTKIGKSKSEQIYYRALTYYLTPSSNFSDCKAALIRSAQDLYGTTDANVVAQAWDNVGVR